MSLTLLEENHLWFPSSFEKHFPLFFMVLTSRIHPLPLWSATHSDAWLFFFVLEYFQKNLFSAFKVKLIKILELIKESSKRIVWKNILHFLFLNFACWINSFWNNSIRLILIHRILSWDLSWICNFYKIFFLFKFFSEWALSSNFFLRDEFGALYFSSKYEGWRRQRKNTFKFFVWLKTKLLTQCPVFLWVALQQKPLCAQYVFITKHTICSAFIKNLVIEKKQTKKVLNLSSEETLLIMDKSIPELKIYIYV